jgi:hypothetical protein
VRSDAPARLIAVPVTGVILGGESDGVTFGGATYGYDVAETIDGLGTEDADGLILELNTPGARSTAPAPSPTPWSATRSAPGTR